MSKKKNTLKDLDDFLKQQAASLVPPEKLSERLEVAAPKTTETAPPAQAIPDDLKGVLKAHGLDAFCDAILASLPSGATPTENEIMLINTALYIKGGKNWKEAVKAYWAKA